MDRFYQIKITGGTSPGLYSIYYDIVNPAFIAKEYPTNANLSGLSLSLLSTTGVLVKTPSNVNSLILYNNGKKCKNQVVFELEPEDNVYPCICLLIFDLENSTQSNFDFCYNNTTINTKPVYSGNSGSLVWNTNGYWDFSGYTNKGCVFRSTDFDEIPQTNWNAVGSSSGDFVVVSQTGTCSSFVSTFSFLNAISYDADCKSANGSIFATALGSTGSWQYSLDNSNFQNLGVFNSLLPGTYTVYAKSSNNTLLSEVVVVDSPPVNKFSVQSQSTTLKQLSKIGFIQYYEAEVVYDTSLIPVGENITFNYVIQYDLSYSQPGVAYFDTTGNTVQKNSINQPVNEILNQPLSVVFPSDCNPTYSVLSGVRQYSTGQITLEKNDSFLVRFVYGIDTQQSGSLVGPCFTKAQLGILSYFDEIEYSCDCCEMEENQVIINQSPQIFQ
jgi:hypothetical protein